MPNRLKMLRERRGLTQQQVADAVDVSHVQISRLERNKQDLTEAMVYRLAATLGCHPGELFAPLESDPLLDEARSHLSQMTEAQLTGFIEMQRPPTVRRGRKANGR